MAGAFRCRVLGLLAAAAVGLLIAPAAAPAPGRKPPPPERECTVPESFYAYEPTLPKTVAALAGGRAVSIVAIGGGSTVGLAAGKPDLAWPTRLGAALAQRFPAARVSVANRGVARQTAEDMAARLEREAIAPKPILVIWETGTMEAVASADIDEFRKTVQAGIGRLRAAGIEMVLMDMQFARRTHAVINFDPYVATLRELADVSDVPIFRRHDIMRHWAESGILVLRIEDREQRRQIAARLYDCIGRALADFISRGAPAAAAPGSGR